MTRNEFRIGNYVIWENEIACIAQIWENEVLFKCGDIAFISDLKPIAISKLWLLNFGYEFICDFFYVQPDSGNYIVFDRDLNCKYKSAEMNSIKYIHQLQNLYFVIGNKELTLKS